MHTFDKNFLVTQLLAAQAVGSTNTAWVNPFLEANRAVFMFQVGTVAGNINFKLTQATDSSGTGAKDISGAAISQITTANDVVITTIELAPGDLDVNNGFIYVRGEYTASAGTPPVAINMLQYQLRNANIVAQDATYSQAVVVAS